MRQALRPGVLGRPRGIGRRGRWGGGIGMGNTCKSMADLKKKKKISLENRWKGGVGAEHGNSEIT